MTPKQLSGYANLLGEMREKIKPEESDPHAGALNLAAYYLYSASRVLHRVAEAKATTEGMNHA